MATPIPQHCMNPCIVSEAGLLQKYDVSGPRYTSYPTAAQFTSGFDGSDFLNAVYSPANVIAPLSLYVHLPFCENICYYCACNKVVTRDRSVVRKYLDHLHKEMALLHLQLKLSQRPVTQLHWGGGTPTFLDGAEMTELMHMTAQHFNLIRDDSRDYAIEIDPRTVDREKIDLLRGLGFNRISLGIQDFDVAVQQAINRIQSIEQVSLLVDYIRERSFHSLNFDLIYGLPKQDVHSLTKTLDAVIQLSPDRISYYNYAHLPERFLPQRAIDRLTLPTAEQKIAMLALITRTLLAAGYVYIGMDHFVKPDDSLAVAQREGRLTRNFQGYSIAKAQDLIGLGVSSISSFDRVYAQNATELETYYAALDNNHLAINKGVVLRDEDILRREIIQSILCQRRLDIACIEKKYAIVFVDHFVQVLPSLFDMQTDNLLSLSGDELLVTSKGYAFMRNICMLFDEYVVGHLQSQAVRYSRTL
ncbi:MAG TPA: oxygen-independent coproporphyrinogen III oxidase [Pseudomonadales bacterium]|nr:oxygen-independent coproporphyrinogen III oxidase [Pseudomonadales bacterium]